MGTHESKVLARRWIEEVINTQNMDLAETLVSPDCVMHFSGMTEPIRGFTAMKQLGGAYFAAFPDLHVAIQYEIAEGDLASHIYSWTGTHRGELQGIPPTGKQVTVRGADAFRIEGGKIVEHWVFDDIGSLMQQLGVGPQVNQTQS